MRLLVVLVACAWAAACSGSAGETTSNAGHAGDAGKADGSVLDGGADAKPEAGGCTAATCATNNADCGQMPDGCGGVTDCGACPAGKYCGGGGPNRCGDEPCEPITCASKGYDCGSISDGCSKTLNCGTCVKPDVCGGGGQAHKCGCQPGGCGSVQCGVIGDDCVGSLDCGSCGSGQACVSHVCCVATVNTSCTKQCYELQGPVKGYSQFEDVWCSSPGQTKASITNCGEPDADPCTTAGLAAECGLVPGYVWCDVTCHHTWDCTGTTQCDGTCT